MLPERMKSKIIVLSLSLMMVLGLGSCIHAPRQAWTPGNNRSSLKAAKPKKGKAHKKRKIHAIKMW